MSCSVSTHVLDTGSGRTASGVVVELFVSADGSQLLVGSGVTDDDGRIGRVADGLVPGTYSLVFHPPSPFFRRVELQLALDDGHYHVPLLVSPYGCATYRGS